MRIAVGFHDDTGNHDAVFVRMDDARAFAEEQGYEFPIRFELSITDAAWFVQMYPQIVSNEPYGPHFLGMSPQGDCVYVTAADMSRVLMGETT